MIKQIQKYIILLITTLCVVLSPISSTNNVCVSLPWNNLFRHNNIPDSIAILPAYCSGFNIHYHTDRKAGIWALSPQTAHFYGLIVNEVIDERYDVQKATNVAINYLNDLYSNYNDWNLAILAFLDSPISLNKTSEKYNIDVNNLGNDDVRLLYSKILSRKEFFNNKIVFEQTPFQDIIDEIDSIYYHTNHKLITINQPIRLTVFCDSLHICKADFFKYNCKILNSTEWLGTSEQLYIPNWIDTEAIETLYELENTYLCNQILIKQQEEEARQQALKKSIEEANATKIYKVKSGDTLSYIAKKHHVTVKQLKEWNNLKSDIIQIGQKIKIKQQ